MARPRLIVDLSREGTERLVTYMQRHGVRAHVYCELGKQAADGVYRAVGNMEDALAGRQRRTKKEPENDAH